VRPATLVRGRRRSWLALLVTVAASAVVFLLPLPAQVTFGSGSALSDSYQSTQVEQLQKQLPDDGVEPALVVLSRTDGAALTRADRDAVATRSADLTRFAVGGRVPPAQYADDGTVGLLAVPVDADDPARVPTTVKELRAALAGLPDGLVAQVTGGPAIAADLSAVFDGADVTLLLVTVAVVALLLLVTYRSPILWLVPLAVVAVAEQLTLRLVQQVLPRFDLPSDGAVSGIVSVLVFGAATDYALLLIARYREELRGEEDRFVAMRTAVARTTEPILASGGTVVLAVLTLLLSAETVNRGLGLGAAIGVLVAMAAALVVLPAALVVCGRGLFWPLVPRFGSTGGEGRAWGRLGAGTARRPRLVALAATLGLVALAGGGLGIRTGLSETEQFRVKPEAVLGAQTLARAFPAGSTQPVAVITRPAAVQAVVATAERVGGVASARPGVAGSAVAQVDVVLTPEPGTAASDRAVRDLRAALADVPGADAAVGGAVAGTLDEKDADGRDLRLILPLILLLVALVLVALLRSLLAPLLLVVTVVMSYLASLGASWLLFEHVLDLPALDSGVLLLAFVFLVALGVDYNIFLVTRAREDAARTGTRDGMLSALRVTGGVITSAGILLAAVFAVLGVLPLITLTQIGVIVCVGVLLDTLLVRTVLVPALAFALGDRFWWPAHPDRSLREDGGRAGTHAPEPTAAR
jgi:putative drug exporter of the RND superfamily